MKVLFLTNLPAPYRVRFFTELGKKCELTVLYERNAASDRDKKWRAESGGNFREFFLTGKQIGADNSFCPEVIRYLKKDYDTIVIGMYSTYTAMLAMLWMKLKGIPYVISTDGGFVRQESNPKKWFKTMWLASARYWLGTGKLAREYLCYYGADDSKVFDYPFTSIDERDLLAGIISQEEKRQIRRKLGIAADKVVVSVGQFIPRKGFDVLLRACEQIDCDDVVFLIIGGTKETFQKEVSKDIPDYIRLYPFMTKQELLQYYKAADFFVLPTREDVWGLVINEAMACGLPVITTNRCGAGLELIQSGQNGYIVKTDDENELANYLNKMLDSEDLAEMGNNALRTMKKYTYQSMAECCYEIFEKNL